LSRAELIAPFINAVKAPDEPVKQWKKEHDGGVIGFLLPDVPEELIHAAGFFPYAITGGNIGPDQAETHLQTWACSYARSCLANALGGRLDFLDGLIVPQACDTMRMLPGIWEHARPLSYMDNYRLPRQVDRSSAKKYLIAELGRLKNGLEQFGGHKINSESLRQSITLYNHNRALFRDIFQIHAQNPSLISSRDLYMIIKGAMVMPRERVNALLKEIAGELKDRLKIESAAKSLRLVLSGTMLEPLETLDFIEEQGGTVVGDDFQNGYRYIEADVPEKSDYLEALAEHQLNRIPSAAFDNQKNPRRFFLADLAREKRADGVIFLHMKYCEPENFDYYDNLLAIENIGIPAMRIETQFGASLGQLRTRIHAFMEMIGGKSDA
jgi:bcr-type benzoyl-CoA reductase subunit C